MMNIRKNCSGCEFLELLFDSDTPIWVCLKTGNIMEINLSFGQGIPAPEWCLINKCLSDKYDK